MRGHYGLFLKPLAHSDAIRGSYSINIGTERDGSHTLFNGASTHYKFSEQQIDLTKSLLLAGAESL